MKLAAIGMFTLTLLLSANGLGQEHTKDSLDTVKKALAEKKAVLIDVREKAEWDQGHLKEARLLPLSVIGDKKLPSDLEKTLPKDKIAYLHCGSGKRCLVAAEVLKKQGYDVRPLKEGYKSLLANGFPKAAEK